MERTGNMLDRSIKIGTFSLAVIASLTGLITWYWSFPTESDPMAEKRIEMYTDISTLIGEMISKKNDDSLKLLSTKFYSFYNGKMILVEDTSVAIAMRRFKFEVDDKLNGVENMANPFKYEKAGMDVIKACKKHINAIRTE